MGMACRLPGDVHTLSALWHMLCAGRSAISELPPDRFLSEAVYDPDPRSTGLSYSKWGGFLSDIAGFDHGFFGISPREAEAMDPQQRLLLMVVYEAMEHAGLTRGQLQDARTGVFAGVSAAEYANLQRYQRMQGDAFTGTGAALSIVANRISHRYNLSGPSLAVDTACSSSLVALDLAVKGLERGDCDLAIVAGANILADFGGYVAFSKANMLSPTGLLAAFDARANGYVRGEGIGAVILKRSADAHADGDRVLARIRATELNQDGRTNTLTAPGMRAQRRMLEALCRRAEVDPHEVEYVEAHGTGTPVGDPIEASAIGQVFGGDRRSRPLLMGSVKPNIGHLEPAAGIAGLIKAVLVSQHRQVPPNANFSEPSPDIAFDAFNLAVPTALTQLGTDGQPVRIAVNSFGFGGTNASVLLESVAPDAMPVVAAEPTTAPIVVPLSAGSPEALERLAVATAASVEASEASLTDIAAALARRDPKPVRKAIVAQSRADLATKLRSSDTFRTVREQAASAPRIAFTYGGQGGQWWGMGRRLLQDSAVFSKAFEEFEQAFFQLAGWSVREAMVADEASSLLHRSQYAMPALFGLQIGLTAYWSERGIRPDLVLGHSFGEVAAAVTAGAIDLADATRLIHVRSQIRERLARDSAMLAIGISAEALDGLIPAGLAIDLAAINSPYMITVAGEMADVAAFQDWLAKEHPQTFVRRVQSDTAWHSRLLAPLEPWFRTELGAVSWLTPRVPFISTVTGQPEVKLDADYWWRNLREPVSYSRAVAEALMLGANVLLELSPHRLLTASNAAAAAEHGSPVRSINSLTRDEDDLDCLARAGAELFEAGIPLAFAQAGNADAVTLPNYTWDLARHWRISEEAKALLLQAPRHHLLGRREARPGFAWSNELDLAGYALLQDHAIDGNAVFPAAGYLELMLAAGREALGAGILELERFEIASVLFIDEAEKVLVGTVYDERSGAVCVYTRLRDASPNWVLRAKALLHLTDVAPAGELAADLMGEEYNAARFYGETKKLGFQYGPGFQAVAGIVVAGERALARLELPAGAANPVRHYLAHPSLLDGALQAGLALGFGQKDARMFLPTTIERVRCRGDLPPCAVVNVSRQIGGTLDNLMADFVIGTLDGEVLMSIEGLGMRPAALGPVRDEPTRSGPRLVQEEFVRSGQLEEAKSGSGAWLLIDSGGTAAPSEWEQVTLDQLEIRLRQLQQRADPLPCLVFTSAHSAGRSMYQSMCSDIHALIGLGKVLRRVEGPLDLTVVTRAARLVPGDAPMDEAGLSSSALVGLSRVLGSELAHVRVRQIDLGGDDDLDTLMRLPAAASDNEMVVRGSALWVPRLQFVEPARLDLPQATIAPGTENFALTMTSPGSLTTLHHVSRDIPVPAKGQVLVETRAVGLNFRDVMAATGLLPLKAEKEPAWQNLGLEFSGTVRALGEGVTGLAIGDRVLGMGKGAMQAFSCRSAEGLVRVPAALDMDTAAAVGSAFATAHYALVHVARLQEGERVLIHLGTGGVGLAAIQIAQACGAEIIATAGNEQKRAYLRNLGIKQVMDSRSLSFADEIMASTGGLGVDVVLNSLSGAAQLKSMAVLKPFGRFLEIGKRDVYEDRPVGLAALARNVSLHVIDLAAMEDQRPELLRSIFDDVMAGFASGRLQPLPITVFPASDAEGAFRLMSQARHIGKVVLSYADASVPVRRPATDGFLAHKDETFLVTGGSGGFGAAVAGWVASRGAGTILLASRKGQLPPELVGLPAGSANFVPITLDVSDAGAVDELFARLRADGTRLRGIFHAAAVFRDGMLEQLSGAEIDAVLAPKALGALHLHQASLKHGFELEVFCAFSSIAETVGSIGQANYVAANSFLEGLTRYRRGLGLSGQVMAWGPLSETGVVARNDAMRSYLSSTGLEPVRNEDAFSALDVLLSHDVPALVFAEANWARLGRRGDGSPLSRFGPLVGERRQGDQLWSELIAVPRDQWSPMIERMLKEEIGRVLKMEPEQIAAERSLMELGFDSLSSIELKNRIENHIGQAIPVSVFVGSPTLSGLSTLIIDSLQDRMRRQQDSSSGAHEAPVGGHPEVEMRRARAYWSARFGNWPAMLNWVGRKNPALPGRGPLRRGEVHQLHVASSTKAGEVAWLLAFGRALCNIADRSELVLARHCARDAMPVRIAAAMEPAALERQIEQNEQHQVLDFGGIEAHGAHDIDVANAWPGQIGFAYEADAWAAGRHDILLEVMAGSATLSFDSDAVPEALARGLLAELAVALPGALELESIRFTVLTESDFTLAPSQKLIDLSQQAAAILQRIESPEATDAFRRAWTLSQAIRVAPCVDVDRLRRAARTIEARHESLRAEFRGAPGQRQLLIRADAGERVILHDHRHLGEGDIHSVVSELARIPISPRSKRLFELHLLQFDGYDIVLLKLFELAGDGWSLAILCDELIRAYLGLDLGPPPIGLDEAMLLAGKLNPDMPTPPHVELPIGASPLGRRAKGLPHGRPELLADPDEIVVTIGAKARRQLQGMARSLGMSENALVGAAYVMALARAAAVDEISLSITQPGRDDPELQRFVGFVRRTHSVVARRLGTAVLPEIAQSLADQFIETAVRREGDDKHPLSNPDMAWPAANQFGYSRLLPDQALNSTLMGALSDYRDTQIHAFSLAIEPLDIGTFGLQETELHLRPLSRGESLDLHFHFDQAAFETAEVQNLAAAVLEILELERRREAVPTLLGAS